MHHLEFIFNNLRNEKLELKILESNIKNIRNIEIKLCYSLYLIRKMKLLNPCQRL